MKMIAAYFAYFTQLLWIAVLLAGFIIPTSSLPGYIDIRNMHKPDLIQSNSTQNEKDPQDHAIEKSVEAETGNDGKVTDGMPDRKTYISKKAALEEYIATFDVGEPYSTAAESAGDLTGNASDPTDADIQTAAGNPDLKLGSRGGGKSTEKPADTNQVSSGAEKPPAAKQGYNQIVLNTIKTYKGGRYPYLLNEDYANYNGVTEDIYYDGKLFLKANPSGNRASHCVGITFEVFFKAMQEWNRQRGLDTGRIGSLSYSQIQDFMLQWYVASGQKDQGNLTTALAQYGLGVRITDLNAVQPGDFIDFSRENNTGHTAVFLGWIWEDEQIVGLKYWSSQGSTGGISSNTEYFNVSRKDGSKYGKIMIDNLYIGRVTP